MYLSYIFLQADPVSASTINIVFIVGFILILYFFMIRPQQTKQKKQSQFMKSLKKGDTVITAGGMYGKVVEIEQTTIILELEKGGWVKFDRNFISFENSKVLEKKAKSK